MRYSLEQVEAFVLVVRHGSFSAAARAMNRSQSTISGAIANLEIALGADLFDRSTRIPSLTPQGQALLVEASALYDRCLAFERHGDALSAGAPPSVSVAVAIPHRLVVSVFEAFASAFPYTDLSIRNPAEGDAARLVRSGEVELPLRCPSMRTSSTSIRWAS